MTDSDNLLAFLHKRTPESSATPHPDREPDRTHEATRCSRDNCTEPPVIPHQGSWWCAAHAPRDALASTHVPRVGETPRATAGMISSKAVIGIREDGTRAPGALPWWWCYGHQPVHVKGAVYAESHEASRLAHGITEAQAERVMMHELATAIFSGDIRFDMTPKLAREAAKRR